MLSIIFKDHSEEEVEEDVHDHGSKTTLCFTKEQVNASQPVSRTQQPMDLWTSGLELAYGLGVQSRDNEPNVGSSSPEGLQATPARGSEPRPARVTRTLGS